MERVRDLVRRRLSWLLLAGGSIALVTGLTLGQYFTRADRVLLENALERVRPVAASNILIVAIDDASVEAIGRWPWRRDRLGLFLDRLFDEYKVSVVGFDVVFAERDESSGLQVMQELAKKELAGVPGFEAALESLQPKLEFDRIFAKRQHDADEYYSTIIPQALSPDAQNVMRQSFAGLLWSKQFYHYVVRDWLNGDPAFPPPPTERKYGRNSEWTHLYNADVISMPDSGSIRGTQRGTWHSTACRSPWWIPSSPRSSSP